METRERIERILLVGCGSQLNIASAAHALRARFPAARLVLLAAGDHVQAVRALPDLDAVIPYAGISETRRSVESARYDLKVALFTGEGQARLKLVSFLLPARRMLIFTEGGGMFAWSFDQRLAIWNHVRWRFSGGRPLFETLRRLARAIVTPLVSFLAFILLLLWHARLLLYRLVMGKREQ
jgi:hypothetical protein